MTTGWPTKRLAEVGEVIRGVSFDKGEAQTHPTDGAVPILRAGNIKGSLDTTDDLIWVPSARVSSNQMLDVGDVVIAMSSGSASVVGKTARLENTWKGSVGAFCAILRFGPKVDSRFGAFWLCSPPFTAWRLAQCQGANIQNLRKTALEAVCVPVPSLKDQRMVVSLLHAADELRRLRDQADRRTADLLPALFHDMFGDPATNPKRWPVVVMSDFVSELQGGKSIATDGVEAADAKYRVLKVSAATWREYQPKESKPVPVGYEPPKEHLVRTGDLLFSRANTTELVGATVFVFDTPPNMLLPDKLWRFVWREPLKVHPLFIWSLFLQPAVRRELGARSSGTSGSMKNIAKPKVMNLKLPLPPLPLQDKFAARVSEVRALQQQQAQSRRRLDDLFQSLLHRAFNGQL